MIDNERDDSTEENDETRVDRDELNREKQGTV